MELKVWTPFLDLEKDIRSMFDRLPKMMGESSFEFRPTTDVVRENGTLVVTAELPGIDPDQDVQIMLEGDLLIIRGEKSAEKEIQEKDRYLHERHFGSFERKVPLPDGVDPDAISASYEKGILTVRVPLPATSAAKARTIPIKVG
jgi:HSP20 family protein